MVCSSAYWHYSNPLPWQHDVLSIAPGSPADVNCRARGPADGCKESIVVEVEPGVQAEVERTFHKPLGEITQERILSQVSDLIRSAEEEEAERSVVGDEGLFGITLESPLKTSGVTADLVTHLVVAFGWLGLGLWVLWRKPHEGPSRAFYVACLVGSALAFLGAVEGPDSAYNIGLEREGLYPFWLGIILLALLIGSLIYLRVTFTERGQKRWLYLGVCSAMALWFFLEYGWEPRSVPVNLVRSAFKTFSIGLIPVTGALGVLGLGWGFINRFYRVFMIAVVLSFLVLITAWGYGDSPFTVSGWIGLGLYVLLWKYRGRMPTE
jgi:hypothetical protein